MDLPQIFSDEQIGEPSDAVERYYDGDRDDELSASIKRYRIDRVRMALKKTPMCSCGDARAAGLTIGTAWCVRSSGGRHDPRVEPLIA